MVHTRVASVNNSRKYCWTQRCKNQKRPNMVFIDSPFFIQCKKVNMPLYNKDKKSAPLLR